MCIFLAHIILLYIEYIIYIYIYINTYKTGNKISELLLYNYDF